MRLRFTRAEHATVVRLYGPREQHRELRLSHDRPIYGIAYLGDRYRWDWRFYIPRRR